MKRLDPNRKLSDMDVRMSRFRDTRYVMQLNVPDHLPYDNVDQAIRSISIWAARKHIDMHIERHPNGTDVYYQYPISIMTISHGIRKPKFHPDDLAEAIIPPVP